MDTFSSLALFVALIAGAVGTFAGAVAVVERRQRRRRWWWAAATALAGAVLASMFGTASLLVHLRFGHGPDSATPMRTADVLATHPAYLGVAALMVLAAAGWIVATFRAVNRRT
jgi:hypothetical protein